MRLAAPNKTQRKAKLSEYGVRYSELLRLPYWDPTKAVVVDGMHNLFLGLVKTHVEVLLGLHEGHCQKNKMKQGSKNGKKRTENTPYDPRARGAPAA